jgi:hypothetical protein
VYKFTYRNHANSYPYASSYAYLVRRLRQFIGVLRSVVSHCDVNNIFINGAQVCPTAASGGEVADGGGDVGEGAGGGV